MNTILTFNFSIEPFTIAYLNNHSKVQISQDQHTSFSEKIDIILKEEFEKNAILLNDIDAIGVIAGPGSYTGLRISMSYVKSLAQIYNIPLFTFNALEATLFNHTTNDGIYLSVLPARSQEVNCALVSIKNNITHVLTTPFSWNQDQLTRALLQLNTPFIGLTPHFTDSKLTQLLSEKLIINKGDALAACHYIRKNKNTLKSTPLNQIQIAYSHAPFITKKEKK